MQRFYYKLEATCLLSVRHCIPADQTISFLVGGVLFLRIYFYDNAIGSKENSPFSASKGPLILINNTLVLTQIPFKKGAFCRKTHKKS
jgi:hypothetical protein